MHKWLLLPLLLLAGAALAAPEYLCRETAAPPVIDGVPSDPAWASAAAAPEFTELGVGGGTARNVTQVRMLMDARALYLCLQAATAPGAPPSAVARERDSRHWGDDCFELMLAPAFTSPDYFHFILSAAGARWDSHASATLSPDLQAAWNPDWEAATKAAVGGWTAELAIPWASLGVTAPARGHVWRVRLAAVARSFPHSTWPRNDSQSFHEPSWWGYLVFRDANLATNSGFEAGLPAQGPPRGFFYAYNENEGKGVCSVTDADHASGRYAGRLEKTDDKDWFPAFYGGEYAVQPGSTYELTAMVKCDRPYVMRYNLSGERGEKRSTAMPATQGWQLVRQEAVIPDTGVSSMNVGFQLIRTKGVILLDDLVVRRLNDITAVVEAVKPPHPYHGLAELASRTSFKPYALLQGAEGWCQPDRVLFRDTSTGADLCLASRSAGTSTRHIYMEMSPWNADGSLLCFTTGQTGGTMLMRADASAWRRMPYYASAYVWDRRLPERIYFRSYRGYDKHDLWDLAFGNVVTGEVTLGRRFEGDISLWPLSQDSEKLLVQERLAGADGKAYSHLWLMNRDARDGLMLDPHGETHQTWFNKLPDYSVEFEWEGQEPPGQYSIGTDGTVRKLFDQTTGHRAHSPSGEWIAVMAGCAIRNFRTGELKVISSESSDHQTWETDNNWYCTSSGRYLRRVVAFGSPTTQLLGAHNSGLKHSTYWTEAHPEMSHDGTKLGYASCMLGDIEFYWLVMGKPSAPQALQATPAGGNVTLTWQPGRYHKETRGYLVYRSLRSGEWGEPITPEPLTATRLTVPPEPACYRVTALEHSGLESLPSSEVRVGPAAAVNVYTEAEAGRYEAPAVEDFDARAAGLYGVVLGRLRPSGALQVPVTLPAAGSYTVWVRARGQGALQVALPGAPPAKVEVGEKQWQWLACPGTTRLAAGTPTVTLTPAAAGLMVDRVCLAGESGYRPEGLGGLDAAAPLAPAGLTAAAADSYATRLSWQPAAAQDLHHYNVYCGAAAGFALGQERLVASPAAAAFVDWGLQAGRTYWYRVTAVDRSGNESAPSAPASAATPALANRLFTALQAKWDTTAAPSLELPFTLPAAGGFVVWGRVQSLDGAGKARLSLALDGKPLDKPGLPFGYISVGHGGPVLNTPLWHCLRPGRTKPEDPLAYAAAAGEHKLTLTADPGVKVAYDRFVVTNDLGFVPEGTVNFRAPQ